MWMLTITKDLREEKDPERTSLEKTDKESRAWLEMGKGHTNKKAHNTIQTKQSLYCESKID